MILPLPVPKNSIETAVRFISLAAYPNFFAELDRPFSPPPSRATRAIAASPQRAPLKVFSVGSFSNRNDCSPRQKLTVDQSCSIVHYQFMVLPHAVQSWKSAYRYCSDDVKIRIKWASRNVYLAFLLLQARSRCGCEPPTCHKLLTPWITSNRWWKSKGPLCHNSPEELILVVKVQSS